MLRRTSIPLARCMCSATVVIQHTYNAMRNKRKYDSAAITTKQNELGAEI
eukprot:m.138843 g.138843  ORF g.138843 m.138843 type:complete len:50 (+) comp17596_c0_seq12:953-1102(+)